MSGSSTRHIVSPGQMFLTWLMGGHVLSARLGQVRSHVWLLCLQEETFTDPTGLRSNGHLLSLSAFPCSRFSSSKL